MNSTYITIGIAIIFAIVAALVGPILIDWSSYKTEFENRAQAALGQPVKVFGEAEVSILPVPTLSFNDIRIGPADRPLMTINKFYAQLDLMPLLTGDINIVEMHLEEPALNIDLDENGRLEWGQPIAVAVDADRLKALEISLQLVNIRSGGLNLFDKRVGRVHRLRGINLSLNADSLIGPYRVDGWVNYEGEHINLQLATGKYQQDEEFGVSLDLVPANLPVKASLDGHIGTDGEVLSYQGGFSLARVLDPVFEASAIPWAAAGDFRLTPHKLILNSIDMSVGAEERALGLTGVASLRFDDAPFFDLVVNSRQIDFDRTYGEGPKNPVNLAKSAGLIKQAVRQLPRIQIPGRVSIDVANIVVGGDLIRRTRIDATPTPEGWYIEQLRAILPGQTQLSLTGELNLDDNVEFQGAVGMGTQQLSTLASWWGKRDDPRLLTVKSVDIDGALSVSGKEIQLQKMRAKIDQSEMRGSFIWRPFDESGQAHISAILKSEHLDFNKVTEAIIPFAGTAISSSSDANYLLPTKFSETSVFLDIDAKAVQIENITAHSVSMAATLSNERLTVRRLSIGDFAGTAIDANGTIDSLNQAPDGSFEANINSTSLEGLIGVLSKYGLKKELIGTLQASSDEISPLALTAKLQTNGRNKTTDAKIRVNGSLGATQLDLDGKFSGSIAAIGKAKLDINLSLVNQDGAKLLRQLQIGDSTRPVGTGSMTFAMAGQTNTGLDGKATISVGDHQLALSGWTRIDDDAQFFYALDGDAQSNNIADLTSLLGARLDPSRYPATEFAARAKITGNLDQVSIDQLNGQMASNRFAGNLMLSKQLTRPRLTGQIRANRLAVPIITELLLGGRSWGSAEISSGRWPEGAFSTPMIDNASIDLKVLADRLELGAGHSLERAAFNFGYRPGELSIDNIKGSFGTGIAEGNLLLQRNGAEVRLTASAELGNLRLEDFVWRRNGAPVIEGQSQISANISGSGRSIASIVAGLNGGGNFSMNKGRISSINPRAFDLVTRAADVGVALNEEEVEKTFLGHLDADYWDFGEISGSLSVASGIARVRSVSFDSPSAAVFGSAALDMESMTIDSSWRLSGIINEEQNEPGTAPNVGLTFSGPISEPARKIDIVPLVSYLRVQELARKIRQIEKVDAEILERDRLFRQMRRIRQLAARRAAEAEAKLQAEEAAQKHEDSDDKIIDLDVNQKVPPSADPSLQNDATAPVPTDNRETPQQVDRADVADKLILQAIMPAGSNAYLSRSANTEQVRDPSQLATHQTISPVGPREDIIITHSTDPGLFVDDILQPLPDAIFLDPQGENIAVENSSGESQNLEQENFPRASVGKAEDDSQPHDLVGAEPKVTQTRTAPLQSREKEKAVFGLFRWLKTSKSPGKSRNRVENFER